MNFLFWNCRGAGNNGFCEVIHDMRRFYHCDILAVVEPRISGDKANKIVEKLNFDSNFRVEANGRSGGLWLMWNKSKINIKIIKSSRHFIHGIVKEGERDSWLFTVVYANPNNELKKQCFKEVAQLVGSIRMSWMVIGDFNEILMASEKVGGARVDNQRIYRFAKWVQDCQLIDLGSKGPKFTWRGGVRNGYGRVYERLDRCFSNDQW